MGTALAVLSLGCILILFTMTVTGLNLKASGWLADRRRERRIRRWAREQARIDRQRDKRGLW